MPSTDPAAPALPPPRVAHGLIPHIPSLAGFWARFFALLLDIVFLHYFFRFCAWGLGDLVFRDERITAAGSMFVFLYYFASLNGPQGGGATIGKAILRLRTSTLDGGVPTWSQSLGRTLLFFPFVFTFHGLNAAVPELPEEVMPRFLAMAVTAVLAVAVLTANTVAAGFNPFKQGLHDFWAGTVVRHRTEPPLDFAAMKEALGPNWMRHHMQPQYSARITFGLVFIGISAILWPMASGSQLPLPPPAQPLLERLPSLSGTRLGATQLMWGSALTDPAVDRASTTGTLERAIEESSDRAPRIEFELFRRSAWPAAPDDPALRRDAEKFALGYLEELVRRRHLPVQEEYAGPIVLSVKLTLRADLILYTKERDVAAFEYATEGALPRSALLERRR